jgi:Zn-dependent protease
MGRLYRRSLGAPARVRPRLDCAGRRLEVHRPAWRWYGIACVADPNGKPDKLWKVALGGLATTGLLALVFNAGTVLPEPAPFLFGFGFTVNAVFLLTNLVPVRVLDGGQMLAGLRAERLDKRPH